MDKKELLFIRTMQVIFAVIFISSAFIVGILISTYKDICIEFGILSGSNRLFEIYAIIVYLLSIGLHMIINELGHFVFGWLSGYRFLSIRFASFMIAKISGKLEFKRLHTLGQRTECRMVPPEKIDGRFPFLLYTIGGCLGNLIFSAVFFLLWLSAGNPFISCFFITNVIIGIAYAIPAATKDIANVHDLQTNKSNLQNYWVSLKTNEAFLNNIRLRDLPDEWFELCDESAKSDPTADNILIKHCLRLIDEHRFEEAKKEIINILDSDIYIIHGLIRTHLVNELVCCEAFGDNNPEVYQKYITPQYNSICVADQKGIGTIRTAYIRAVLIKPDTVIAAEMLGNFKKMNASYPYPIDYQCELELIEFADKLAQERQAKS